MQVLKTTLNDNVNPYREMRVGEVGVKSTCVKVEEEACQCNGLMYVARENGGIGKIKEGRVGSTLSNKSIVIKVEDSVMG